MVKVGAKKKNLKKRGRKFRLWFKPSWKMSFEQYVTFYYKLDLRVVEKLRRLTAEGKPNKRFEFMAKYYKKLVSPESDVVDHAGLVEGLRKLNLPANSKVVSYGAGDMYHECFLLKDFPQISSMIGVEPLEAMRRLTGKIAFNILGIKKRKKIKTVSGLFEDSIKIPANSAEAIITNEAFHHVKNPEIALRNMASKLKPNGGMVIVYRPDYKTKPPNPIQLGLILRKVGLRVIVTKPLRKNEAELNNNLHLIVAKKD